MNWYQKIASRIDVPPKMVDNIVSIILNARKNFKEGFMDIPIDLEGWKYGGNELKDKVAKIMEDSTISMFSKFPKDTLEKVFEKAGGTAAAIDAHKQNAYRIRLNLNWHCKTAAAASWQGAMYTLHICMNALSYSYNKQGIESAVRHELVHFCQTYLNILKSGKSGQLHDLRETGTGMPSKKIRTPEFEQYQSEHPGKDNEERFKQHSLDDVEFYSNLETAIQFIK